MTIYFFRYGPEEPEEDTTELNPEGTIEVDPTGAPGRLFCLIF